MISTTQKQINFVLAKIETCVNERKVDSSVLAIAEEELTNQFILRNSYRTQYCENMKKQQKKLCNEGWSFYGSENEYSKIEAKAPNSESKTMVRLCQHDCCNYSHLRKDIRQSICLLNRYGCCEKRNCIYDHSSTEVPKDCILKTMIYTDDEGEKKKIFKAFFYLHSVRIFDYKTEKTFIIKVNTNDFVETKSQPIEVVNTNMELMFTFIKSYFPSFSGFTRFEFDSLADLTGHIQELIYNALIYLNTETVSVNHNSSNYVLRVSKTINKCGTVFLPFPNGSIPIQSCYSYNHLCYPQEMMDFEALIGYHLPHCEPYLKHFNELKCHISNIKIDEIRSMDAEDIINYIVLYTKYLESREECKVEEESKIEEVLPEVSNDTIHEPLILTSNKDDEKEADSILYKEVPVTEKGENFTLKCLNTIKDTTSKAISDIKNLLKFY